MIIYVNTLYCFLLKVDFVRERRLQGLHGIQGFVVFFCVWLLWRLQQCHRQHPFGTTTVLTSFRNQSFYHFEGFYFVRGRGIGDWSLRKSSEHFRYHVKQSVDHPIVALSGSQRTVDVAVQKKLLVL